MVATGTDICEKPQFEATPDDSPNGHSTESADVQSKDDVSASIYDEDLTAVVPKEDISKAEISNEPTTLLPGLFNYITPEMIEAIEISTASTVRSVLRTPMNERYREDLVHASLLAALLNRTALVDELEKNRYFKQSVKMFYEGDKLNYNKLNLFGHILLHIFRFNDLTDKKDLRALAAKVRKHIDGRSIWTSDLSNCSPEKQKILKDKINKYSKASVEEQKENLVGNFESVLGAAYK